MKHLPLTSLHFGGGKRIPIVLQTEASECALACLTMVACHHGYDTDLASLRSRYPMSAKGTTLAQLIQVAARLHLSARAVRVELDALDRIQLPAILHWDMNHFVVLTQWRNGAAVIHDPASGQRILRTDELSKHFTGIALELTPDQDFVPKTERQRLSLRGLLGKARGLKRSALQILLLAGVLEIVAIASPWLLQLVVDHALVSEDRDLLVVLIAGFLLLALLHVGITALRAWVLMILGTQLNLQLLTKFFRQLLQLPLSYFEKRHLGDIVSRFESLNVIERTLTTSMIEAIVDGIMALATFGMMLIYSGMLAAVVGVASILYAVIRWLWYRPLREAQEEQILRAAKQQSHFLESVRGVQSVKLFNRGPERSARYHNLAADQFNASIRVQRLGIAFKASNGLLFGAENVAVVGLGALLVLQGDFSVGMLFAFIAYKQQFVSRVIALVEKSIELKMLGLHTERVGDVALTPPERDEDAAANFNVQPTHYDIEVKNLVFRYSETEAPTLTNINLHINEGESVAIIGPSGCGKTTLMKVMLGLLPPTQGEILIGGVNLARMGVSRYRESIAAVMQEDQLFAGSIADNISFFDPQPDNSRLETCAQMAAVHADILTMPMGYYTMIGDLGTALSGGQKQRLLLARALYKEPKILFLDEATSHLDVAREHQVNDAIAKLKLTRIIIAHRPETIASADRVIDLSGASSFADNNARNAHSFFIAPLNPIANNVVTTQPITMCNQR